MVVVLNPAQTAEAISINSSYIAVAAAIGTDDQLLQSKKLELTAKLAELQNMMKMQPRDLAAEQIIFNQMNVLKSEIEALELSLAPHLADMVLLQNRSGALFADIRQTNGNATDDEIVTALNGIVLTPTITTSTTSLAFPNTVVTYSNVRVYSVSAVNLTANLTINISPLPSPHIKVSLDGITYSNSLTLTPDPSGTIPDTIIYVRFKPTTVGTFDKTLVNASVGAPTINVIAGGSALPMPVISTSVPSLAFGNTIVGMDNVLTYDVGASNLLSNLDITSNNTEITLSSDGGLSYHSSLSLTPDPSGTIPSTTIHAKYSPLAVGTDVGNLTHISSYAASNIVSCTGNGILEPIITITPTSLDFGTTPVGVPVTLSYTLDAVNLIGNLTISSDNSKTLILDTDGVSYVLTSVLTPDPSGSISTTIYLQYDPPSISGDIGNITNSSPMAADKYLNWSGVGS